LAIVIDTSAAAPFILADEADNRIPEVAEALVAGSCFAPALFNWELANLIWKVRRNGRIDEGEQSDAIIEAHSLSIAADLESSDHALGETLVLALRHDLTAYDAAYLELAIRLEAGIATFDNRLRMAALAEGIRIYPKA
jgi:predicted nucleic acid-binding protein